MKVTKIVIFKLKSFYLRKELTYFLTKIKLVKFFRKKVNSANHSIFLGGEGQAKIKTFLDLRAKI